VKGGESMKVIQKPKKGMKKPCPCYKQLFLILPPS